MAERTTSPRGAAAFERMARAIVRRPLVPIAAWVVLLVVAVPFLSHLGSVTTSSSETVPSNAPSQLAAEKLGQLFPNTTGGSSAIVLLVGPDLVGAAGQRLVLNLTAALASDRNLSSVASVDSVYTVYAAYLAGQTELAAGAIAEANAGSPNLTTAVNETASLLWGPPVLYLEHWEALVNASGPPASAQNLPAYNATAASYAGSPDALAVLSAFYGGTNGSATGFNGTASACATLYPDLAGVVACADTSARLNVGALPPFAGSNATIDRAVLAELGVGNASAPAAQLGAAAAVVAGLSGLPAGWLTMVWQAFGGAPVSAPEAAAYANASVAATTLANEPLPVPLALSSQYVNAAGTASVVSVSFSLADDVSNATGGKPVYHDLGVIANVSASVLAASPLAGTVSVYQTGPAPLDQLANQAVNSSLGLVLPLTVGLLLGIAMLYFRSPVAPLVAFAGLGVALVLGLGGTVLIGTLVTHLDSTALVLEEVFVLGVGTDYSVFLVARYREEIVRGRPSDEAIVSAVTWAGQSIATSGSTAIIVTLALAFSGVALLSQWGMVLSLAILITMLVALTLLPAFLKLLGPRIFWPMTGARFRRSAATANDRTARGATYFYRAARLAERHPAAIVAVIVLVSIPLVAVALEVPVSYDFYDQLPSGHSATDGLAELGSQFGPGYAVPTYALVTFAEPLRVGNVTNAAEFEDVANLTLAASTTSGIAVVRSPVGPYGASLSEWLALPSEPAPVRANLLATLAGYVGTDGRTVLFQLQTNATGLSYGAVAAVSPTAAARRRSATWRPRPSSPRR